MLSEKSRSHPPQGGVALLFFCPPGGAGAALTKVR